MSKRKTGQAVATTRTRALVQMTVPEPQNVILIDVGTGTALDFFRRFEGKRVLIAVEEIGE